MNKTYLVIRNEIVTVLRSKTFLFFAFALPVLAVVIFLGVGYVNSSRGGTGDSGTAHAEDDELQVEGYVDLVGLISEIPEDVPAGILVSYDDENSALQALRADEIKAYYVIPTDYLEAGDLIYVYPDYSLVSEGQSWVMRQTIFANLLENDSERVARAWNTMDLETRPLDPNRAGRDDDNPLTFVVPYATMMIFYMVIIMSASLLMNSVGKEKSNLVIEVLLSSVSPRELLVGKVAGLGILGLVQTGIWVGTAYSLLSLSGRTFSLPAGFELPPSIIVWGLVFFLLGYAVYASLMAGLGALVPNMREASQAVILVIWPLIIPLFMYVALVEQPHGALAVGLSLFPLTSPVAMMTRLAGTTVPWWQLALAVLLLVGTAVLVVRSVAGIFHAQTLLSGQPFSARRFARALLGRI
jgi:ABC-2 type transport system permease protein